MSDYIALLIGIACAGAGGELFVRGTVGIAGALRISPGIIAATVAAFATSSPELTVSINSALQGMPRIALGDALGSNVVNVALILAAAVLISPITTSRDMVRRDLPVTLTVPVILAALLFGLGLLIVAGWLIVSGATGIAAEHNIDTYIVGATVVALGTSVPELATAIISGIRGHKEVGLGTILGSNIFNGLFIVGVAASIAPITITLREVAPALTLRLAAVALTYPPPSGTIGRWRGITLLGVYLAYLAAVLQWS